MFIRCPILKHLLFFIKDNHRQNTTSNKTQALTKSVNTDIWLSDTLSQLFLRGSYTQIFIKLCS